MIGWVRRLWRYICRRIGYLYIRMDMVERRVPEHISFFLQTVVNVAGRSVSRFYIVHINSVSNGVEPRIGRQAGRQISTQTVDFWA